MACSAAPEKNCFLEERDVGIGRRRLAGATEAIEIRFFFPLNRRRFLAPKPFQQYTRGGHEEEDLPCIGSSDILGCDRNPFGFEELKGKLDIAVRDVRLGCVQHVATAKHLCNESSLLSSRFHHLIDQELHGVHAVAT